MVEHSITSLSSAYKGLLASATSPFAYANNTMILTLGGLTIGTNYQVQFWVNDSSDNDLASSTILTSGNMVSLEVNTTDAPGGVGQWVTGTFTAVGATQTVNLTSSPQSAMPLSVLNAFQVRTVPEPTSCGLLGLGAVLIASHRRRRA